MLLLFWTIMLMLTAIFIKVYVNYHNKYISKLEQERETPLEILKRRFAQGEINEEEYEARKEVLQRDQNGNS